MQTNVVYLIHFENPYVTETGRCVQHYLGSTNDVEARLAEHRRGTGNPLLKAASQRGIAYDVVRTWPGNRQTERKMKNWKNHPMLCPICRRKKTKKKASSPG